MTRSERHKVLALLNTVMMHWRATIDDLNAAEDRTKAALDRANQWDVIAQKLVEMQRPDKDTNAQVD